MNRPEVREWLEIAEVSGPARLIFIAIDAHCNGDGLAHPSTPLLAARTCYSRSTVVAAIRELIEHDYIRRIRVPGHANRYEITWSPVAQHLRASRAAPARIPRDRLRDFDAEAARIPRKESVFESREVESNARASAHTPRSAAAAQPPNWAAAAARLEPITDERGTFLPGTGWIPESHDPRDVPAVEIAVEPPDTRLDSQQRQRGRAAARIGRRQLTAARARARAKQ
jgi:hypothetical protein